MFGDQDASLNTLNKPKTYIGSDHRDDYSSEDTINVKSWYYCQKRRNTNLRSRRYFKYKW